MRPWLAKPLGRREVRPHLHVDARLSVHSLCQTLTDYLLRRVPFGFRLNDPSFLAIPDAMAITHDPKFGHTLPPFRSFHVAMRLGPKRPLAPPTGGS